MFLPDMRKNHHEHNHGNGFQAEELYVGFKHLFRSLYVSTSFVTLSPSKGLYLGVSHFDELSMTQHNIILTIP